jgi:hypothetical protein
VLNLRAVRSELGYSLAGLVFQQRRSDPDPGSPRSRARRPEEAGSQGARSIHQPVSMRR